MRWFVIWLLLSGSVYLQAQDDRPPRTYLHVDTRAEQLRVVTSPLSAYVVKSATKTTDLQILRFDTLLNEVWALQLQRSLPELSLVKAMDNRLFLLMSSPSGKDLDVLELDEETGHYVLSSYSFTRAFQLRDFAAYKQHMWCSGFINEEGIAFALDPASGGVKTLPIGAQFPIAEVTRLDYDQGKRQLMLTMRSLNGKKSVFIQRAVDLEGKVRRNDIFETPTGLNLKDFEFYTKADIEMAVGTLFKGNPEQLKALATWVKRDGNWQMEVFEWKDIPGLDQRLQINGQESSVSSKKAKWTNGLTRLNKLRGNGPLMVMAIDRFEKQYNVRSALQRQQDQEILVNQLDQNQFGRRGFDVDESTLEDRVEDFSNTDYSTYRFRDMLVGPLEDAGTAYTGTVILTIDDQGKLEGRSIKSDTKSFGNFADGTSPIAVDGRGVIYFSTAGTGMHLLPLDDEPELKHIAVPMGPYSQPWLSHGLLNFGFVALEETVYLFLQRYEW